MRVRAVWKKAEERIGAITDIRYFKPIGAPGKVAGRRRAAAKPGRAAGRRAAGRAGRAGEKGGRAAARPRRAAAKRTGAGTRTRGK
jgi:hypothetical protein